MKLAYADPPYPGQAQHHYKNDPSGIVAEEVDHRELLIKLRDNYDGWALSTSSPAAIFIVGPLINELFPPFSVRKAPWCKSFCSWKPTQRAQYTHEEVFFVPTRPKGSKDVPSVRDYLVCRMTMGKGTHGAKPPEFNNWVLNLMGYQPGDSVDDLYPGPGGMGEAVKNWKPGEWK
jgi:hypothetical protein